MTCCSFRLRKVPSSTNREDASSTHAFNLYTYAELRSTTKDFSPGVIWLLNAQFEVRLLGKQILIVLVFFFWKL
ncbi:hypothetical protein Syun_009435 [Stephania yunnanensis]|uniref:Uncharacterized protein n=1 Tax=Stephania yunnanensis TaxID=152371 RepID=A0AAP0KEH1_9MAGN